MPKFKVTPTGSTTSIIVEADTMLEVIERMKEFNIAGKIVRYNERPTSDRALVKITCGWGKDAHSWTVTKGDAVKFRNTCPDHR